MLDITSNRSYGVQLTVLGISIYALRILIPIPYQIFPHNKTQFKSTTSATATASPTTVQYRKSRGPYPQSLPSDNYRPGPNLSLHSCSSNQNANQPQPGLALCLGHDPLYSHTLSVTPAYPLRSFRWRPCLITMVNAGDKTNLHVWETVST
jgi:hypothetical protein